MIFNPTDYGDDDVTEPGPIPLTDDDLIIDWPEPLEEREDDYPPEAYVTFGIDGGGI